MTWVIAYLCATSGALLAAFRVGLVERNTGGTTAATLGRARALICGVALFYVVVWEAGLPATASLPIELTTFTHAGVIEWLTSRSETFAQAIRSESALRGLKWSTSVLLVLAMLGVSTRLVLPFATLGYFLVGGIARSYSHLFHTGLVPLYLLAALCFLRCSDDFAVRSNTPEATDTQRAKYGWGLYALWFILAHSYLMAGLSKLRIAGIGWPSAHNLRSIILVDNLNPMEINLDLGFLAMSAPDWTLAMVGWFTLLLEVGYISVLVSRRARTLLPVLAVGMHVGIALLQNVIFVDLIVLQLIFYELGRVPRLHTIPTTGSAATDIVRNPTRWALVAGMGVAATAFGGAWIGQISYYPLSPFPMYTSLSKTGPVWYYAINGHYASGERSALKLETYTTAFRDARYRDLLVNTFRLDDRTEDLERAYRTIGVQIRDQTSSDPLVAIEVEQRVWDFTANPNDQSRGRVARRVLIDLDDDPS